MAAEEQRPSNPKLCHICGDLCCGYWQNEIERRRDEVTSLQQKVASLTRIVNTDDAAIEEVQAENARLTRLAAFWEEQHAQHCGLECCPSDERLPRPADETAAAPYTRQQYEQDRLYEKYVDEASAKHDPLCNSFTYPGFHCDCVAAEKTSEKPRHPATARTPAGKDLADGTSKTSACRHLCGLVNGHCSDCGAQV